MQIKFLSPRMQDRKEADLGFEIFPARGNLGECFGDGAEQQVVDHSLVLKRERRQLAGQREDHVEVLHRQELLLPILEPLSTLCCLTLRAVPIATGVVSLLAMSAGRALQYVASKTRRATGGQCLEHQ